MARRLLDLLLVEFVELLLLSFDLDLENRRQTNISTTIHNPYITSRRNRNNTNTRRTNSFATPQQNSIRTFPRVSFGPGDRTNDTPTSPLARENLNTTLLGTNDSLPSDTPLENENTPTSPATPTAEELQLFLKTLSSNQNEIAIANIFYFKCKYYTIQVEGIVHTSPN